MGVSEGPIYGVSSRYQQKHGVYLIHRGIAYVYRDT